MTNLTIAFTAIMLLPAAHTTVAFAGSCPAEEAAKAAYIECTNQGLAKAEIDGDYSFMSQCLASHDYRKISCDGSEATAVPDDSQPVDPPLVLNPSSPNGRSNNTDNRESAIVISEAGLIGEVSRMCDYYEGLYYAKLLNCGSLILERERFKEEIWNNVKGICAAAAKDCSGYQHARLRDISRSLHCTVVADKGAVCE